MLRTQGLESESPLAFAALHRLLRPVLGRFDRAPGPQARALRVAFGQEDGPAVEPFLVAVATLSMLTEAAEESTGAVRGRRRALARLRVGRRAAVLRPAARRGPGAPWCSRPATTRRPRVRPDGFAGCSSTGSTPTRPGQLLDRARRRPRRREVADRLVAETGGNPLALLELPDRAQRRAARRDCPPAGTAAR